MMTGDAAAEDQGEFVGLTDGAIGIDESLLEGINGGTTTKDEIVGELHLGKKQPVLNTGCFLSSGVKKGVKRASHLSAQVIRSLAVRESASFCRVSGSEHCTKAFAHC